MKRLLAQQLVCLLLVVLAFGGCSFGGSATVTPTPDETTATVTAGPTETTAPGDPTATESPAATESETPTDEATTTPPPVNTETPTDAPTATDEPPTATATATGTATTEPTPTPTSTVTPVTPTATASATATAVPGPTFELGGQVFSFLYLDLMRESGMTWMKMQIRHTPGGSTADAENLVAIGERHGLKVLLSVVGDQAALAANPTQYFQEFAAFLAAVARVGPDAIEVWNEPNIDREWPAGLINGTNYAQMLSYAYPAIKQANPNVMVISGAPAPTGFFGGQCRVNGCDDLIFIQQMAAAGADQYFDCTGIHYNEGILPPTASTGDPRGNSNHYTRYYPTMVNTYVSVFPDKPLCFTELGYLSPEGLPPLPPGFEWASGTSVQEQAEWLAQAAQLSRDNRTVRLMIVWNMDATIYGSDPMAGWAIIRNNTCLACVTLSVVMGQG